MEELEGTVQDGQRVILPRRPRARASFHKRKFEPPALLPQPLAPARDKCRGRKIFGKRWGKMENGAGAGSHGSARSGGDRVRDAAEAFRFPINLRRAKRSTGCGFLRGLRLGATGDCSVDARGRALATVARSVSRAMTTHGRPGAWLGESDLDSSPCTFSCCIIGRSMVLSGRRRS